VNRRGDGVPNANYITITLAGVNDGCNIFDLMAPMGVLLGDVDGDGFVLFRGLYHHRTKELGQSC
jgi:hypothetical protein